MDAFYLLDALQLDDQRVLDQKINPIAAIQAHSLVLDRLGMLQIPSFVSFVLFVVERFEPGNCPRYLCNAKLPEAPIAALHALERVMLLLRY